MKREKLQIIRELSGYSLRELAEKSQCSLTTLWKWENGKTKPHPSTKRKVAEVLGISPGEIE